MRDGRQERIRALQEHHWTWLSLPDLRKPSVALKSTQGSAAEPGPWAVPGVTGLDRAPAPVVPFVGDLIRSQDRRAGLALKAPERVRTPITGLDQRAEVMPLCQANNRTVILREVGERRFSSVGRLQIRPVLCSQTG